MSSKLDSMTSFGFHPGHRLMAKYRVIRRLGGGWEGEVYHVVEEATGIDRAAKFFFPKRNRNNSAVKFYAQKLNKLKNCPMLIHYHTQETLAFRGEKVTFLVSEFVEGAVLSSFLARQRGKRLDPFQAMHLLHTLARGVEDVHNHGEYHGDLHLENIIIARAGIGFRVKLLDFYHWGPATKDHLQEDICGLIRIFYDALGGPARYKQQPPEVKAICRGLKRSLIVKHFPTAERLRKYLEHFEWTSEPRTR